MGEVVTKIFDIITPKLPPDVDFIEQEIINNNIEPLRWAIIEIKDNKLTISASGRKL